MALNPQQRQFNPPAGGDNLCTDTEIHVENVMAGVKLHQGELVTKGLLVSLPVFTVLVRAFAAGLVVTKRRGNYRSTYPLF